jgi:hypothetical protein
MRWLGLLTVPLAVWMIWSTHHLFPNDPFLELVPGYIVYPSGVLALGAVWWRGVKSQGGWGQDDED